MWTIEPQIPWSLWWALAVVAAIAWIFCAPARMAGVERWRRLLIAALMGLGIAIPLLLLLNPTYVETVTPPSGKPLISVVVDATESMLTEDIGTDGGSPVSRWQSANRLADRVVVSTDGVEVRKLRFDDRLEALDDPGIVPSGGATDLGAAMQQTLAVDRPQGHAIVFIGDGTHNVGPVSRALSVASAARSMDVPIYTMTLGGTSDTRNIAISARNPQLMSFPARPVNLRVELTQRGYEGRDCLVRLKNDDGELESKRVTLSTAGPTEVSFALRVERAGLYRYRLEVDGAEGEATLADNQTSCQLQIIDKPIQVLLLEGKPYWDTKFLARNLAADPAVELTSMVRVGEERFMQRTDPAELSLVTGIGLSEEANDDSAKSETQQAVPGGWTLLRGEATDWSSAKSLEPYRIVVLGRSTEAFLDEAAVDRLRAWISRQGGALVCSRGNPSTELSPRLSQILPVRWRRRDEGETRVRGALTSLGQSAALLTGEEAVSGDPLPGLPSLALGAMPSAVVGLPQVLVSAETNAAGESIPLVTHQRYGSGQTVVVEGAGMWRWAFLPPEQADSQRVYAELWQGLMQWLISQQELLPGQTLALRVDRVAYVTGEQASATLLIREGTTESGSATDPEDPPTVLLSGGDLQLPKRFSPAALGGESGVFRINFGGLAPGHYVATLEGHSKQEPGATTEFDVRDPWFERLDVDARPGLMREIAERSGGRALREDEIEGLASEFERYLAQSRPPRVRRTTLWDRPWVMMLCLACWGTGWLVRRRSGLV